MESTFEIFMDNKLRAIYKINQKQLNILFEAATDEELLIILSILEVDECKTSFTQKRKALTIKNRYLWQII